jgi:hypothetical protein
MRMRFAAALAIALCLATGAVRATGTSHSASGTKWNGTYGVISTYYTADQSYHDLRMHYLMEFQAWDGSSYQHCAYWPPSYCSWEHDTGYVNTNLLLDGIDGSMGAIVGRFVVWVDYYVDGSYDATDTVIASWP